MLARVFSCAVIGLEGVIVKVEVAWARIARDDDHNPLRKINNPFQVEFQYANP